MLSVQSVDKDVCEKISYVVKERFGYVVFHASLIYCY